MIAPEDVLIYQASPDPPDEKRMRGPLIPAVIFMTVTMGITPSATLSAL